MLRVGLTGGIGAGKSTVAARLVEHGATLIDADHIAREIVEPGTEGLAELVDTFGNAILTAEGALDRAALAATAFADDAARQRLNNIMHPRIGARTAELMEQAAPDAVVVHDIPLLVEGGLAPAYHLVIVVEADEELRVRRVVESRGMPESDARARISAQASPQQRRAVADVWLDNSGSPDEVLSTVDRLWADRLVPYEENLRLGKTPAPSPKLVPYDPAWPEQAGRMLARIRHALDEEILRADHIGPTAVAGLPAPDVLDLQLTVRTVREPGKLADALAGAGFVRTPGKRGDEGQHIGTPGEELCCSAADPGRPAVLHIRPADESGWRQAVLFRDWLRAHPGEAGAYAEVRQRAEGEATGPDQQWIREAVDRAEDWAARTGWTPEKPA